MGLEIVIPQSHIIPLFNAAFDKYCAKTMLNGIWKSTHYLITLLLYNRKNVKEGFSRNDW